MNRADRRRARSEARRGPDVSPARQDGRPLYFDIGGADKVRCYFCEKAGVVANYTGKQAVMNDPANPPKGEPLGAIHTICIHHLPDNAVIYDPRTNYCRNKAGDHSWEEAPRQEITDAVRKAGQS